MPASSHTATSGAAPLPRWVAPALLAVLVALFAARNLPWHLDDYDQAKQAFTSWEMVHEGHWWFQHTPTGNVATKPPLAGWISAVLALATGARAWAAWELAWRLPPLLCAIGIAALLWKSGRQIGGAIGGVLASGAFGLNLFAPRLASLVRTDMMLTLFIFLAGWLICEKLRAGTAWTTRERWAVFAVVLASMLTKGPIAYAFLLPGLAAFWILQRRAALPVSAWSGWWSWFGPLLVFAVWAGVGVLTSPEFYDQVVRREFLGRFTTGEAAVHHNFGPHFYFAQLLSRFFPWSIALLALACVPDVRAKLRRDPALLWLACWALGGLVFMSLVPSKRADRIFPVIPPLCLLLAAMAALLPRAGLRNWPLPRIVLATLGLAALVSGGYAAWRIAEGFREHDGALVEFGAKVRALTPPQRIAVVSGKDEGMLLYTGATHFTRLDRAVEAWRRGELDALVLPLKLLKAREDELKPFRIALQSMPAAEKQSRYVCLVVDKS